MITMVIVTNSNPRGLCFWKLNTSFQSEDNYVTKIKNTTQKTKNEYANNSSVFVPMFFFVAFVISRERLVVHRHFSSFMSPFQRHGACQDLP